MKDFEKIEIKTNLKSRFKPNHDRHERGRYGLKTNKVLVKSMRSTVSQIPEETTLKVVGGRNPVTHVTSYGNQDKVVLGYQIGEQQINPSVSMNNPINSNIAGDFKGIAGGVRAVYRCVKRNDLFSFRVVKTAGKITEVSASPDTISYAREFFKLSSLLDNSQATYLPIMMAVPKSITLSSVPVKNISSNNIQSFTYEDVEISVEELEKVFGAKPRMLNIYILMMMADLDISNIASLLYEVCDTVFKKGKIFRQKFFEKRSHWDIWMNNLSKSRIVKPLSLFISKLLSKKLISENFWNASLAKIVGVHAEFDGYSGEVTQTSIMRSYIKSYKYSLSGSEQTMKCIYDEIKYKTASGYMFHHNAPIWVEVENSLPNQPYVPARNLLANYTDNSNDYNSPLLRKVVNGDVEGATKVITEWVDHVSKDIIPSLQNRYNSLESLHYALNGGGGALGFTSPFWNINNLYPEDKVEYNTYFDSIAFSSIAYNAGTTVTADQNLSIFSLRSQSIFDEKMGLVTRTPINYDGQTPDILSKDLYYRNIPMNVWSGRYFDLYASGTLEAFFVMYNRDLIPYSKKFIANSSNVFANDYELVINWMRRKTYDFKYSIVPNSSITLDVRSNNFYLYMDATSTTQMDVAKASNFGSESSPINKVTSEMLIR